MEEKIISAKTLDEAITKACVDLGVPSDELEYTVKQTGSNGFFGIGAKPFVISARIKGETLTESNATAEKNAEAVKSADAATVPSGTAEKTLVQKAEESSIPKELIPGADTKDKDTENASPTDVYKENRPKERRERPYNGEKRDKREQDRNSRPDLKETKEPRSEKKREERRQERRSERPAEDPTPKAEAFLASLFESMNMQISCSASFDPDNNELSVDLSGEDMGVLIGKRGQTLDALQYLTSQVINRHQNAYVRVKLDTENYRERRKDTLETLAVNIAHKVRRTHRPVALEPMNPYERRIIHSILQNEKDVFTRSEGEEPYRHVVVCPTRRNRPGRNRHDNVSSGRERWNEHAAQETEMTQETQETDAEV